MNKQLLNSLHVLLAVFALLSVMSLLTACGKGPSTLLRNGQAPIYDFPLYISAGDGTGTIWKFSENGTKTALITGLNDPRGIATDKFNNLYVVEYGTSSLLKIKIGSGQSTVIASGLSSPSAVAVDSFGEAYVTQEGANNILRGSDQKIMASFASRPTALSFGVNDLLLVGLFDSEQVFWGMKDSSPSASVQEPVMIATDGTGRVYVAEGLASNAKVYRYHQREPSGKTTVVDGLNGAVGIAVDSVGNVYVAEPGASRIVLVTFDGQLYNWAAVTAPQYMTFTQY